MGKQITGLTATRGVAAIWVVLYHTAYHTAPFTYFPVLLSGKMAVSYFFVLSGFVLCYSYKEQHIKLSTFAIKRFARIYPLYLLGITLGFFANHLVTDPNVYAKTATNLLLIQAWFPFYAVSVNAPAWSLCAEVLFYVLFPLLLWLFRRQLSAFLIITAVLFIATQVLHFYLTRHYADIGHTGLVFMNPLLHLNEFLVGMAGLWITEKLIQHNLKLNAYVVLAITIAALYGTKGIATYNPSLVAPVYMLLIVAITLKTPRVLLLAPIVWLGNISYSLYLLHAPMYALLQQLNTTTAKLADTSFLTVYLVLLHATAWGVYTYFELPAQRWINGIIPKQTSLQQ